jgi:hypothetical protein
MRPLTFISLLLLCNLYGLVFDFVAVGSTNGIVCEWLGAPTCSFSQPVDYWLSAVILLLLMPMVCLMLANWLSGGFRLLKSSAFLGLLLITP